MARPRQDTVSDNISHLALLDVTASHFIYHIYEDVWNCCSPQEFDSSDYCCAASVLLEDSSDPRLGRSRPSNVVNTEERGRMITSFEVRVR